MYHWFVYETNHEIIHVYACMYVCIYVCIYVCSYMAGIFTNPASTSKSMTRLGQSNKLSMGTEGRLGQVTERKIRLDILLLHNPIVRR
jgi:hypothetical protein